MALQVTELFHSIQGESIWMGLPCAFVRLTGCNLRCRYCDTTYAYDSGQRMTIEQVLIELAGLKCRRVTVTGGEPLTQSETPQLLDALSRQGYRVSMETNGSIDIGTLASDCMLIMDLKCPSSGMQAHNLIQNIQYLKEGDQIKFVIAERQDYEFACSVIENHASTIKGGNILFSPVLESLSAERLAGWILTDDIDVRLQLQLHRHIWPNRERGV